VEKTGHKNLIVVDCEIDGVRKAPEQATSEFVMNILVKEGVMGNIAGTGIKHPKKLFAKSRRFRFIPRIAPIASSSTSGRKRRVYVIFFFLFSLEGHQETGECLVQFDAV
jgi:hypothetical protein